MSEKTIYINSNADDSLGDVFNPSSPERLWVLENNETEIQNSPNYFFPQTDCLEEYPAGALGLVPAERGQRAEGKENFFARKKLFWF